MCLREAGSDKCLVTCMRYCVYKLFFAKVSRSKKWKILLKDFSSVIEKIDQLKRTLDFIDVTKRSEILIFQWL